MPAVSPSPGGLSRGEAGDVDRFLGSPIARDPFSPGVEPPQLTGGRTAPPDEPPTAGAEGGYVLLDSLEPSSHQIPGLDDWPIRPVLPGDWRNLGFEDSCALLARYAAREIEEGVQPSALQLDFLRARAMPLVCFHDWLLIEVEARLPDARLAYLPFFYGPQRRLLRHTWNSDSLHGLVSLAWHWPLIPAAVEEFLRLFVGLIGNENGRFRLAGTAADVDWCADSSAQEQRALLGLLEPLSAGGTKDGAVFRGTVIHQSSLFRAEFRVLPAGQVVMDDDEFIREVRVRREVLLGPCRIVLPSCGPSA